MSYKFYAPSFPIFHSPFSYLHTIPYTFSLYVINDVLYGVLWHMAFHSATLTLLTCKSGLLSLPRKDGIATPVPFLKMPHYHSLTEKTLSHHYQLSQNNIPNSSDSKDLNIPLLLPCIRNSDIHSDSHTG